MSEFTEINVPDLLRRIEKLRQPDGSLKGDFIRVVMPEEKHPMPSEAQRPSKQEIDDYIALAVTLDWWRS